MFQGDLLDLIDIGDAVTANKCLEICKETDGCQWFSFLKPNCYTFKACYAINEGPNYVDFVSGQVQCPAGYSK